MARRDIFLNTPRRWSSEDDQRLRDLWVAKPLREIGRHLGRSEEAARKRGARLGLPPTRTRRQGAKASHITPDMIEQLAAAMWKSRATVEDPRSWETAGDLWWKAYRELGETAYHAVRRIDAEQA